MVLLLIRGGSRATLRTAPAARFSETARSRPGHREARGHRWCPLGSAPEVGRRPADDLAEGPAEAAETGESDVEAHAGDAAIGRPEQEHRPLDAPALKVAVRRFAE